jgi:hypothetical protein
VPRPLPQANLAQRDFGFWDLGCPVGPNACFRASASAFPGDPSVMDSIVEGGTPLSQPLTSVRNPKMLKPSADRLVVTHVMFIHGSCGI